jgi:hypothetical protein
MRWKYTFIYDDIHTPELVLNLSLFERRIWQSTGNCVLRDQAPIKVDLEK